MDWGTAVVAAMFLLLGVIFLWQCRSGLLYHTPIYTKGPSWLDPWAALVAGVFFSGLGLFGIATAIRRKRKPEDDH
ncbi:MAG: hypothetical protein WA269_12895 [Candidatus Udaeobacter sp.]